MKKFSNILYWIARIAAAIILGQTLFFKFSAAEESVYIFTTLGMEPWGRITIGIFETVAALCLLINRTAWIGGALSFGLMAGAIGMHFTKLGISVQGDGGYLFFLAIAVALCSAYILMWNKAKIVTDIRHVLIPYRH